MDGRAGGRVQIDVAFGVFDADNSGALDREEFKLMMAATFTSKISALQLMMGTDAGYDALLAHAKAEYSDENVSFIHAVQDRKAHV